jgi:hypothetical protein
MTHARISTVVFSIICLSGVPAGIAGIDAIVDPVCFRAAVGPVTVVDFEDLPVDATSCPRGLNDVLLPNPLVLAEVQFVDEACLHSGFCSSPTCTPDPRNPHEGNIVLFLNPGARIELPPRTTGVLLEVQGIGSNSFTLRAIDLEGQITEAISRGVLLGVTHLGFVATHGLSRVEIVGGPLVVSTLLFGSGGEAPACGQLDDRLHLLDPQESGTLRSLPELGILEKWSVGPFSTYSKTTAQDREFRRGFVAFDIPDLDGNVEAATLFLEETGGNTSAVFPPDLHEVSFFDADRSLEVSDFHRSTSALSTLETRLHVPNEVFSFDVAQVINRFRGTRLWFRIKLGIDPDFAGMGSFGASFQARMEVRLGLLFTRGDVDGDGRTDLTDAVSILEFLFLTGSEMTCLESGNVDDDDRIDIADPIALLQHLFQGGPHPPEPFPECGVDDSDSLSCRSFEACL